MFCTRSHSDSQKNEQTQHLWEPSLIVALCCVWAPLWDLWYEPRPHWTKCCINKDFSWVVFQWKNQNGHNSTLNTWPMTKECKTHHNQFFHLLCFLPFFQHWWLQQLQKVDSALAFNLVSNKYSIQINGDSLQSQFYSSAVSVTHILT